VVELVDTQDLKSCGHCGRAGSIPAPGTQDTCQQTHWQEFRLSKLQRSGNMSSRSGQCPQPINHQSQRFQQNLFFSENSLMDHNLSSIRQEYCLKELTRESVNDNPLFQFQRWLEEALAAEVNYPTAMNLSTSDRLGHPSARIVLLKDMNERGLSFFTNYESKKAKQLAENPHAALVFFWPELERQVRFEGITEKVSPRESDDYFNTRPDGSKAAAWASRQSTILASRKHLESEMLEVTTRFENRNIPRPPFWGGYRLLPELVEFWQGRESRLHDRIEYRLHNGMWKIHRLAP
jgi:pyridoxamine 5'-phosphate oxidase